MAISTDTKYSRPDWADDVSDSENISDPTALPAPVTTVNKDGTKTTVSYKLDDAGKRVKVTRKTRTTVHKEKVNPAVAERRSWAKFGLEKGKGRGPQSDTTSVGENIVFRPSRDWKNVQADEAKSGGGKAEEKSLKEQLRDKKVKCRICGAEHFTAKCPYKDTMAPIGDDAGPVTDPMADEDDGGKKGGIGGSYVPPHLRKGGAAASGERMGGKYERDDLATLRVTNVSFAGYLRLKTSNAFCRYLKWLKSKNFVISLKGLVALQEYSSPKIGKLAERKDLRLFLLSTGQKLQGLAKRWMVLVTDISF